jgi:hypothetical protein
MTSRFDSDYGRRGWEDAVEEYNKKYREHKKRMKLSTVECKGCFLIVPGSHTGTCSCGASVCLDCCALGDPENAFCYECSQSWAEETEWLEEKEMWEAWNLAWKPVMTELLKTVRCV